MAFIKKVILWRNIYSKGMMPQVEDFGLFSTTCPGFGNHSSGISVNILRSKDRDSGRTVPRVCDRDTVLPSNDTAVISDRMRCHEFTHVKLSGIDSHRVMNDPAQDGVGNDTATEVRMPFTGLVL